MRALSSGERLLVRRRRLIIRLQDLRNFASNFLELGGHFLDYVLQLPPGDILQLLCRFVHLLNFG